MAKTNGDDTGLMDEKGKTPIRRSRTEAANSASEAGINHKLIAGGDKNLPAPGQPTRRKVRRERERESIDVPLRKS